jgi:hypothetical protein
LPTSDEAECASHPGTRAVTACARCGNYVCAQCFEPTEDGPLCEECEARLGISRSPSSRAVAAFVCALFGIGLLCVPLAPVAVVLGYLELGAIGRNAAPRSGRTIAIAAVALGSFEVAAAVAFTVVSFASLGFRD